MSQFLKRELARSSTRAMYKCPVRSRDSLFGPKLSAIVDGANHIPA